MIKLMLRNRVFVNLTTLFIIGAGTWQFFNIRREAFPEITFNIVTIQTVYPGALPEDVEKLVTIPIEDTLKTVNNIDRVESYSIEGLSLVIVRLEDDLGNGEVSRAVSDIQQAVSRVKELPEETSTPLIEEMTSDRPLIVLSVAGGEAEVRDRFAERLKDMIEDISGVSKVVQDGDRAREIWVEVDPAKLERYRMTVGEIAARVREENTDLPAGFIQTGKEELLVRTAGAFKTAEDIGAVILRGNDERSFVRVRDVAHVRETFAEARVLARAAGLPAINLQVRKTRRADTIDLADAVKKLMEEQKDEAAALGLQMMISDDVSFFIKRRLNVMRNNLLQGGILIMAALFAFLDWRLALVAAIGVPLSFAIALIAGGAFGLTINLLSLLGFIIVLGLLDDDSVVSADNIYRHLEMGKTPFQAAADGAREVLLPITAAVATTMAAFLPFALMTGIMGKFMYAIPVVVLLCLASSLFESFLILPSHVLDILPLGKPVEEKAETHWTRRLSLTYRRALNWSADHRYRFMAILAGFLILTGAFGAWRLKLVLFPPGLIDQFFIQVEMPEGTALPQTEEAVSTAESVVLGLPAEQLEGVTATVGLIGFEESVRRGTHYGQLRVFLTPQENREIETDEIISHLRPRLDAIPGIAKLTIEKIRPGPPVGRAVQVRIRGDDPRTLQKIAHEMKETLRNIEGVFDVKDNFEGGKTELRVRVNPKEAAYAGVSTAQVARHILYAFEGGEITKIRRSNEEVVVKVKLDPQHRKSAQSLEDLLVLNNQGRQVRLDPLIEVQRVKSPPYIERYRYKRAIQVTADVDNVKATSYGVNAALKAKFENLSKSYPGYDAVYGGEEEQTQESLFSLRRGFVIALLLNLIILATLFNSYVKPVIILMTIPIGLVGVAWALILHGEPASFMSLMGAVAMTGVVVNNAIVIVDFIARKREEGLAVRDAIIEAGAVRLRPVIASSLTTLAGLVPTAYGLGGKEPFVAPMCLALAWGLAFAMPLTLFVIPMATLIVDDTGAWFTRKRKALLEKFPKRA